MRGRKTKLPVQLGRRPIEKDNEELLSFYEILLRSTPGKSLERGNWSLCDINPVGSYDNSFANLIAYQWWINETYKIFIVNFSSEPAQGHIRVNDLSYGSSNWSFEDLLTGIKYIYKGKDLDKFGLYVKLSAWTGHIFDVNKAK